MTPACAAQFEKETRGDIFMVWAFINFFIKRIIKEIFKQKLYKKFIQKN